MFVRRLSLKLLAFFVAFGASVALVLFVSHETRCAACALRRAAPPPPRAFNLAADLGSEVELVTLDRERGRSYTRVKLWLTRPDAAPERLRVRTYFFSPDDPAGRAWAGDSVEIRHPFAANNYATVTVAADCDWCDDEGVPASGFFARVQFTDETGATTPLPWAAFGDISTAAPVVVHAERARPSTIDR